MTTHNCTGIRCQLSVQQFSNFSLRTSLPMLLLFFPALYILSSSSSLLRLALRIGHPVCSAGSGRACSPENSRWLGGIVDS